MRSSLSILVILVCVGAYFVYIKPFSAEIKSLNAKKSEYENVLNKVKEINQKREEVSLEYDNIPPQDINKINRIIPEKIDSTSLANDISGLGSKYGLSLKEFKMVEGNANNQAVETSTSETYKTVIITLRMSGQYNQFVEFLKELELGLNLVDVVSLVIKGGGVTGQSQSALMDYTLEVRTYSLR